MILRGYQETNLQQMRECLGEHRSVLYVLPCGGGKGSVTTYMVKAAVSRGLHVTFAVRGLALVNDMSRRLSRLGLDHGVLRGGKKREADHLVQVASVDTLFRMDPAPPAHLLILDEARTFSNASGRHLLDMYPNSLIVGLDATPILISGKGLGKSVGGFFESIVVGPDEQGLIDQGFLCPSLPLGTGDPPDVTGVGKFGGDFETDALAEACNKPKLVGDIVSHWLREAAGHKTVAFGVNRKHAQAIRDAFVAAGIEWEYVDGETPDDEREAIYARLDQGTLMGIANCQIAGVGWDHPIVSCIISAQPTLSLARWRQQMGRISRIYPGKLLGIILDHAGNTVRHWPFGFFETPPVWTLEGIKKTKKAKGETKADPISMCKRPVKGPRAETFTGAMSDDGKYMLPCFCYFKSGPKECPRCGLPLITAGRKIETEAGELKDLSDLRIAAKAARKAGRTSQDEKLRKAYLDLVRTGLGRRKANGEPYSPKWATMQFRQRFGKFPNIELIMEGRKLRESYMYIIECECGVRVETAESETTCRCGRILSVHGWGQDADTLSGSSIPLSIDEVRKIIHNASPDSQRDHDGVTPARVEGDVQRISVAK